MANEELIDAYFTKNLITNYNTRKGYKGHINKYFRLLEKDVGTYFNDKKTLDDYENDLNKVYMILEEQNISLLSRRTFFNTIKQFMCSTDKRLKQLDFWEILKNKVRGSSPLSVDFVPNPTDIKTVLQHGNALSRAMFLIQSSTGCRIGELIALYPEDINIETTPATVIIRRSYDSHTKEKVKMLTKTRKTRTCFITDEAKDAYVAWMKERDKYLSSTIKRSRYEKNPDDKRIFPMSDENARTIWSIMVKKSGLFEKDSVTNRLTLHPHCLRKFFRSYLGNSDLAEHLMGHASGMDKFYRNMKKEDLAKKFLEYMPNITILSGAPDLTDVHRELHEKSLQMKQMQEDMQILKLTLQGVQNQLEIEKIKNGKK